LLTIEMIQKCDAFNTTSQTVRTKLIESGRVDCQIFGFKTLLTRNCPRTG